MSRPTSLSVGIVGGGASGLLAAIQLMELGSSRFSIVLFEPSSRLGAGLAYGTDEESHLLNVPASRMSCFQSRPADFMEWLSEQSAEISSSRHFPFVPRKLYRKYLNDRFEQMQRLSRIEVRWYKSRVQSIKRESSFWTMTTDDGVHQYFQMALLATGYEPQLDLSVLRLRGSSAGRKISLPGEPTPENLVGSSAPVLILGSGLTAVDIWRQLRSSRYEGVVHLISRRGLVPLPHLTHPISPTPFDFRDYFGQSPREWLRLVRAIQIEEHISWPAFADILRSQVNSIWSHWSVAQQKQFMRHVKPYWEVIRHRLPATVHEELAKEIVSGKIQLHRAHLKSSSVQELGLEVILRDGDGTQRLTVSHAFLATGSPVKSDLAVPDGPNLYRIGPASKGQLWEITAIPEIRSQIHEIVSDLMARKNDLSRGSLTQLPL